MNLIAAEQVLEPWHKLEDKVVLVTGASSGIGRDFCIDLAKAGSYVVAAARRLDRLTSLCHEINRLWPSPAGNSRAVAVELDVAADASTIDKAVQKAWDAYGRIDSLINNAGVRGNPLWHFLLLLFGLNSVLLTSLYIILVFNFLKIICNVQNFCVSLHCYFFGLWHLILFCWWLNVISLFYKTLLHSQLWSLSRTCLKDSIPDSLRPGTIVIFF